MKVPSPGESISEVEIAQWLVEDGDYVEKDQEIAEVDSDKATLALPAEESGTIKLVAEEGDTVEVGQVVCIIDTDGVGEAKTTAPAQESAPAVSAPSPTKSVDAKATPLAKAIISQNDLSPKDVKGSGEGGKILKEDVMEAIESVKTEDQEAQSVRKCLCSEERWLSVWYLSRTKQLCLPLSTKWICLLFSLSEKNTKKPLKTSTMSV